MDILSQWEQVLQALLRVLARPLSRLRLQLIIIAVAVGILLLLRILRTLLLMVEELDSYIETREMDRARFRFERKVINMNIILRFITLKMEGVSNLQVCMVQKRKLRSRVN
jgi:hypothetical protein